jgi:hypothetical protein
MIHKENLEKRKCIFKNDLLYKDRILWCVYMDVNNECMNKSFGWGYIDLNKKMIVVKLIGSENKIINVNCE